MQTLLFNSPTVNIDDILWQRAALKECLAYGDHGQETETAEDGREICFNCGGSL